MCNLYMMLHLHFMATPGPLFESSQCYTAPSTPLSLPDVIFTKAVKMLKLATMRSSSSAGGGAETYLSGSKTSLHRPFLQVKRWLTSEICCKSKSSFHI